MENKQTNNELLKHLLNQNSEEKIEVNEATEILNLFGLSNNDKKTREYVNKGSAKGNKLIAIPKGKSLEDRRMGYSIQVNHLIDFINEELPAVLYLYQNLGKKPSTRGSSKTSASKAAAKSTSLDN